MDCCKYGDYRAGAAPGAAPTHAAYAPAAHAHAAHPWDSYAHYAPLQYAPYAHNYYAAHDPYARYYRYDYSAQHLAHTEHGMQIDYGGYASKDVRTRRTFARRDSRARTPVHLPLPPTPPLECGLTGRNGSYYEPSMWHHYQMGIVNNGGWGNGVIGNTNWPTRPIPCREQMRYSNDLRSIKSTTLHSNPGYPADDRRTPYSMYEESSYSIDSSCHRRRVNGDSKPTTVPSPASAERSVPDRSVSDLQNTPPPEKRPPAIVPLPAFQQAFGSTEIGKFAEAFSRTEVALEEMSSDTFSYESYSEWDNPLESQWPSQNTAREIKCEESV